MGDLLDAPAGGTQQKDVTDAALKDHFFVEFTDARAGLGGARRGQENPKKSAICDGATTEDGDASGSFARADLAA